jgi:GTPase
MPPGIASHRAPERRREHPAKTFYSLRHQTARRQSEHTFRTDLQTSPAEGNGRIIPARGDLESSKFQPFLSPPNRMRTTQSVQRRERVLLVGVALKRPPRGQGLRRADEATVLGRDSLDELQQLAESAGAEIAGTLVQVRDAYDPGTLVGRGKLDEIRAEAQLLHVPLLIIDHNLTPVQLRNMEKATGCRVIDRTQLILDIFATHAHSREGQLQVELAQLNYLLPRLAGGGDELSRLGGGIGTRGPGEQKLETDRRRIRERVGKIRRAIEAVRNQRTTRRRARQAVPLSTIALVGYTNAGKSTLFNALTHAEVLTSSRMFATLDPTIRAIELCSKRRVLLSDTVGFIRDLPPDLIAAFRATLEEVQESALILHVTDISNRHHAEQDAEVAKILRDLGVGDRPRIHVLNKADRLTKEEAAALTHMNGNGRDKVVVSAATGAGLLDLLAKIDSALPSDPVVRLRLRMPLADGRHLSLVQSRGRVFKAEVLDGYYMLEAELPESAARQLQKFVSD